ncbi:MAG: hypothetical protein QXJ74_09385 [Nitrososphaera sp.]
MNGREDEAGPVLERPQLGFDHSRVWQSALWSLEQVLGRDTTAALCFHISTQSGMPVGRLLIEDPEGFRQTMLSILQGDVDVILKRVAYSTCAEFGLERKDPSFVKVIHDLVKKR